MKTFISVLVLVAVFFSASCNETSQGGQLIVMICIDQLLPEYLDPSLFPLTRGLKKLARDGFYFTNADLNYAFTLTGPGHASFSTGTYPRTHGIIANEWIDANGNEIYCVQDKDAKPVEGSGGGFSPKNLVTTALGDWLKEVSPQSRVYSVAGKDRSAVLMGGKKPDGAFWLAAEEQKIVTSSYYVSQLPEWTKDGSFNKNDVTSMDDAVLKTGLRLIRAEKLGRRGVPDMIWLGLSATDYVGHSFGSESEEMRNHLNRLDEALGNFLEQMTKTLGHQNVFIVVTSDHGAHPAFGNAEKFRPVPSGRIFKDLIRELNSSFQQQWNTSQPIIHSTGDRFGNVVDYQTAQNHGVPPPELERIIRSKLLSNEAIQAVYFKNEMVSSGSVTDPFITLYRNNFFPELTDSFWIRYCEHCIQPDHEGTTHGSPYRYDSHVPLLFWSPSLKPGRSNRPVHTVDAAPTVARWVGVPVPNFVEGKVLPEITARRQ